MCMCTYWNRVNFKKSSNKTQEKIDSIEIGLASPTRIRRWGERRLANGTVVGKVDKDYTVDYESLKPIEGGLFCERIFGPVEDFYCSCERKGEKNERFCPTCEVEFTRSQVRRTRMGYIPLAVPVAHVWYLRGRPSYIANLIGKNRNTVDKLAYGETLCESFTGKTSHSPSANPLKNAYDLEWQVSNNLNFLQQQAQSLERVQEYHVLNFHLSKKGFAEGKQNKGASFGTESKKLNFASQFVKPITPLGTPYFFQLQSCLSSAKLFKALRLCPLEKSFQEKTFITWQFFYVKLLEKALTPLLLKSITSFSNTSKETPSLRSFFIFNHEKKSAGCFFPRASGNSYDCLQSGNVNSQDSLDDSPYFPQGNGSPEMNDRVSLSKVMPNKKSSFYVVKASKEWVHVETDVDDYKQSLGYIQKKNKSHIKFQFLPAFKKLRFGVSKQYKLCFPINWFSTETNLYLSPVNLEKISLTFIPLVRNTFAQDRTFLRGEQEKHVSFRNTGKSFDEPVVSLPSAQHEAYNRTFSLRRKEYIGISDSWSPFGYVERERNKEPLFCFSSRSYAKGYALHLTDTMIENHPYISGKKYLPLKKHQLSYPIPTPTSICSMTVARKSKVYMNSNSCRATKQTLFNYNNQPFLKIEKDEKVDNNNITSPTLLNQLTQQSIILGGRRVTSESNILVKRNASLKDVKKFLGIQSLNLKSLQILQSKFDCASISPVQSQVKGTQAKENFLDKYNKLHTLPVFSTYIYKEWSHRFSFIEYFTWAAQANELALPFYISKGTYHTSRAVFVNWIKNKLVALHCAKQSKPETFLGTSESFESALESLMSETKNGVTSSGDDQNRFNYQNSTLHYSLPSAFPGVDRAKQEGVSETKDRELLSSSMTVLPTFSYRRTVLPLRGQEDEKSKHNKEGRNNRIRTSTANIPQCCNISFSTYSQGKKSLEKQLGSKAALCYPFKAKILEPVLLTSSKDAIVEAKEASAFHSTSSAPFPCLTEASCLGSPNASTFLFKNEELQFLQLRSRKVFLCLALQNNLLQSSPIITHLEQNFLVSWASVKATAVGSSDDFPLLVPSTTTVNTENKSLGYSKEASSSIFRGRKNIFNWEPFLQINWDPLLDYHKTSFKNSAIPMLYEASQPPTLPQEGSGSNYFGSLSSHGEQIRFSPWGGVEDTQQFPRLAELLYFTGGTALHRLLDRFNLVLLSKFLRYELKNLELKVNFLLALKLLTYSQGLLLGKLAKRRSKQIRRLKLLELFQSQKSDPRWMILSVLPVLPPDLRPILRVNDDFVVASDLNRLYQTVLRRNNTIHERLDDPLPCPESGLFRQRSLQKAVDGLLENGKGGGTPLCASKRRPLVSLSHVLKGKKGLFRQHLLGKRVDYSGRSVIVVGPKLNLHECGLPKEMALELFQPFLIHRLKIKGLAFSNTAARRMIQQQDPAIWRIMKQLVYEHPVLLNRAPTLHRLGIQAFQPRLVSGRAILLHPLVCNGFNADFDGDQMAVHVPLSFQTRAEAWKIMWSKNNLLSPATGQPILVPSQDMVLGCYYLSVFVPRLLQDQTNLDFPTPVHPVPPAREGGTSQVTLKIKSDKFNFAEPVNEPFCAKQRDGGLNLNPLGFFKKIQRINLVNDATLLKKMATKNDSVLLNEASLTGSAELNSSFYQLKRGHYFSNLQDSLLAFSQGRLQTHIPFWVRITSSIKEDSLNGSLPVVPKVRSKTQKRNESISNAILPSISPLTLPFGIKGTKRQSVKKNKNLFFGHVYVNNIQKRDGDLKNLQSIQYLNSLVKPKDNFIFLFDRNENLSTYHRLVKLPQADDVFGNSARFALFQLRYGFAKELCKMLFQKKSSKTIVETNDVVDTPLELRLSADGKLVKILPSFQNHYNYNATVLDQCQENCIKYMRTTAGRVVINEALF